MKLLLDRCARLAARREGILAVLLGLCLAGCNTLVEQPQDLDGPQASAEPASLESAHEPQLAGALAPLHWLSGTWSASMDGDQVVEEIWSPAGGDAMVGMLRWQGAGKVSLFELMSIEAEDDALFFYLRHFHRKLEPWAGEELPMRCVTTELGSQRVVFEALGKPDFPNRFCYERKGQALEILLEDKNSDQAVEFVLTRVVGS